MLTKRLAKRLAALIIIVLAGSSLNSGVAQATPNYLEGTDAAAVVFNPLQVSKISLRMSDSDYNSMRWPNVSWDNEGEWRETQMRFTMGSNTYGPYRVGVHLKGAWGSWRDITGKAAFKIKMDAFVDGQTFFGISKMTLNNMVQDGSYIHEVLTYRLFRAVGVPASRTGFADVTLNGINYGLHMNVETVNPEMLKRWNMTSSQMVKGAVPYLPDFWVGHESDFAIESGIKDSYTMLSALIEANQLDGAAWWERINELADMKEMTLEWATEIYTEHWDGYVRNRNNYYVNFDDDGKATMLPWGTDQTWNGSFSFFESAGLMLNKCFAWTECNEMYLQSLARVATKAKALELPQMAANVSSAIRTSISQDPFGPGLDSAEGAQSWTVWQLNSQQEILSSMTAQWDTSLRHVGINGVKRDADIVITLEPGTKSVRLTVFPSQTFATTAIQPIGTFKAGLNSAYVRVTSADGAHTNTEKVLFYVLTKRSNVAKVSFTPGKATLTASSKDIANALAAKYQGVDGLTLTLSIAKNQPKAKALLDQRSAALLAALKLKGVVPTKVIKTLTATGSTTTLMVSGSYRN